MDERLWSKARSLAYVFGNTYDEDVAVVLGEALLETLAELLVPEDEQPNESDLTELRERLTMPFPLVPLSPSE